VKIVTFGLPVTSFGPGSLAPTYRGLVRELDARGHDLVLFEHDASSPPHGRGAPAPRYGRTIRYRTLSELKRRYTRHVRDAHLVVVGSGAPEGVDLGRWVIRTTKGITAFYDTDTPATLARLDGGGAEYLTRSLIQKYSLYLSLTGGPTLERLEQEFRAPMARELYCSFDPALFYPDATPTRWDLGYLGAADDWSPALDTLLLEPARQLPRRKFVVAGLPVPGASAWPKNVHRRAHCPATQHRRFYSAQRFTLNVTTPERRTAGFAPGVRLFEAAACGTPIVSDPWPGLERIFRPRREILIARSTRDMLTILNDLGESERREIGRRARERVLADHTAAHRAAQLERYVTEARTGQLLT